MVTERMQVSFAPRLAGQPLLYALGKECGVVLQVRRTRAAGGASRTVVEIVGSPEAVARALAWARGHGLCGDGAEAGAA